MSTTITTIAADRPTIWRHGVVAATAAAAATTTLAAAAHAAGVSFEDSTGAAIPLLGFTQVTLVLALVGVGLAALSARRARFPRRAFVRTTLVLLALSLLPEAIFGFDAISALTLMGLHVVAAAIVVPILAARLRTRQ